MRAGWANVEPGSALVVRMRCGGDGGGRATAGFAVVLAILAMQCLHPLPCGARALLPPLLLTAHPSRPLPHTCRRGDIIGALGYAEGPLSTLRGASLDHDARLRDVVALIAYQQPEQVRGRRCCAVWSTLGHVCCCTRRSQAAPAVTRHSNPLPLACSRAPCLLPPIPLRSRR